MWPAARHYAVDPISGAAATLNPEQKSRILGGEACMWTEWVTPENIDSRIWPRTAAIAERLWSPQEVQDPNSMYVRLGELSWRLEWLGLTHISGELPILHRMAGTEDISALRTLADVVEPVKDYTRMDSVKGFWDFRAPLNHLVDVASPESEAARHFGELVQAYIQGGHKDQATEAQIRTSLTAWRDNDAKLHPLLEQSFLLSDIAPLSEDLSALGVAGAGPRLSRQIRTLTGVVEDAATRVNRACKNTESRLAAHDCRTGAAVGRDHYRTRPQVLTQATTDS